MKKLLLSICTASLFILSSCSYKNHIKMDFDFLSYDEIVVSKVAKYDDHFKKLNIGFSSLVIKDNTAVVSSAGTGDFDENTVFNIGSATKKMTSILLLQEVEKGNIQLSDSIGKYLTTLNNVDGSLTIETLLRHKSGLGELVGSNAEAIFFSSTDSLYVGGFLNKIPESDIEMVGNYQYCNTNYILLGHILQNVTDMAYTDLLRERIFEPAEMYDSHPYVNKNIPNLAHPMYNGVDVFDDIQARFFNEFAFSAGSVASTLSDMAKFYTALLEDKTLINNVSLNLLTSFDESDYGLGIMNLEYQDQVFIGHGGNNIGYGYREYYNPTNGDLVLFFSNSLSVPYSKLIKEDLLSFLFEENNDTSIFIPKENKFIQHLGTYFFEEMGLNVELLQKDKDLYLKVQENELLLYNYDNNLLASAYHGIELEIIPNETDSLTFKQSGMQATLTRIEN